MNKSYNITVLYVWCDMCVQIHAYWKPDVHSFQYPDYDILLTQQTPLLAKSEGINRLLF